MQEGTELELLLDEAISAKSVAALKEHLRKMNPVDIAQQMGEMDKRNMLALFLFMDKDDAADVFTYLDSSLHQQIIEAISLQKMGDIIAEMAIDDAVDTLQELPSNMVRKILEQRAIDSGTRQLINSFLKYPENSAGSLMTSEFVCLFEKATCAEALDNIRRSGVDKETIYTCYVTDDGRHLTGIVSLRNILTADVNVTIGSIMCDTIVAAHTHDDQEEVAKNFAKYDLMAMPVLDFENRIVGIITIDDVVDVMEEELTEDVEKMAALKPSEDEYLQSGVCTLARNRILWLLVLMLSASWTAWIIGRFEGMLQKEVILAAFLPLLTGTCGNSGAQVSTLIVRGMALGEIELKDWLKILLKELQVGSICALALAFVNFMVIWIFDQADFNVNFVVNITLICSMVLAKLIGGMLPLLAKICKFDPALMASPLLTTSVDVLTIVIYFGIATCILQL
ncbi:MAG: magnesium transporter [Victivallales bacterium]|nr:magnesium transporter [Victivallales bacterium]